MTNKLLSQIRKAADVADVHVDTLLSNISVAYLQDEGEFIANKVFPVLPVAKQSDKYMSFPKRTFMTDRAKKWVPGTAMPQSEFDVNTDGSYACEFRGFEYPQRWDIRANADNIIGFDRASVEYVSRILLLGREIEWATKYFTTLTWGKDYTGVASGPTGDQFIQWNEEAGDPIGDYKTGRLFIKKNTGYTPNTAVMSQEVFEEVCENAGVKEKYKYTRPGMLTEDIIADVLRVKNLYIAGSINITSDEGVVTGSETYDWIYGKNAWLGYVPPAPSLLTPAAGYIFSWTGMTGGFETAIERIPDRRVKADYIQGVSCFDMGTVSTDLGVFFSGAVG